MCAALLERIIMCDAATIPKFSYDGLHGEMKCVHRYCSVNPSILVVYVGSLSVEARPNTRNNYR